LATPEYEDISYEVENGVAIIAIDRPDVLNAFRDITIRELISAFETAWDETEIGVVVLTGVGDRAFCVGGDQSVRGSDGYGGHRGRELGVGVDIMTLHNLIRDIPKPVIAAVNGYAIGGGHVLHVLCDITIASERAVFGQVGPKVGSFDAGYGSLLLADTIGEKRAKEMWYFCRRYDAQTAMGMGLVNEVVPHEDLMNVVVERANELLERSPFALAMMKSSFNANTSHARVIEQMAMNTLGIYYGTPESFEGRNAFREKRAPRYAPFRSAGPSAVVSNEA
jgi:dihydroxynaphthoic acid synthetase